MYAPRSSSFPFPSYSSKEETKPMMSKMDKDELLNALMPTDHMPLTVPTIPGDTRK